MLYLVLLRMICMSRTSHKYKISLSKSQNAFESEPHSTGQQKSKSSVFTDERV